MTVELSATRPDELTPESSTTARPTRSLPLLKDSAPRREEEDREETPYKLHHRFDRMGRLIGDAAIERLLNSRVMVIGLGGVGSFAAESLVRSAVGHLALVDFDRVCVTNANRQIQALAGNAGKLKAQVLAERMVQANPQCQVQAIPVFYSEENAESLLAWKPDAIVDAIDNITAKCHLLATCRARGIPVVSALGAAGRLDPTAIATADLAYTKFDPMARVIRKILRQKYGVPRTGALGISAVYSTELAREPVELHYDGGQGFRCLCPGDKNDFHSCEERRVIYGTASFVTGTFGLFCAGLVVNRLIAEPKIP